TNFQFVVISMVVDVIEQVLKDLSACYLHSALTFNRVWSQAAIPLKGIGKKSTQFSVHKDQPLYDYPIFIRELNYTNLLACEKSYKRVRKVEAILQTLTE
ncbi:7183_t:CDS:2, partial [Funneliformis caledonium]